MANEDSKPPHGSGQTRTASAEGLKAKAAAATARTTAYCCECGKTLAPEGTCQNEQCKFSGEVPDCP